MSAELPEGYKRITVILSSQSQDDMEVFVAWLGSCSISEAIRRSLLLGSKLAEASADGWQLCLEKDGVGRRIWFV